MLEVMSHFRAPHSPPGSATSNAPTPLSWDWRGFAWAFAVVIATTAMGWPLYRGKSVHIDNANILMLYLLGVLWIATHHSRSAAVLASVLAVVAFDLVFVKPFYSLAVADPQYLVTFAVMLLTALVISELTHRVRVQSEAARQAWERAEAEFLRNTLLSGVSHELRTPLAGITGAASALIEAGDQLSSQSRAQMLDTIASEAERMERLIKNLLDMTWLEAGGLKLNKQWQPLQEVVGSALHRMNRRLSGRAITTDVPNDLPLVQIDAVLIEQLLINLLDNAMQYTPPGSAIEISARQVGSAIEVEVADHGPGIPTGTEDRVFQKFFRAGQKANQRGMGLGLAICRGFVEAHGGTIAASNRPTGGASFRFKLPIGSGAPKFDAPNIDVPNIDAAAKAVDPPANA